MSIWLRDSWPLRDRLFVELYLLGRVGFLTDAEKQQLGELMGAARAEAVNRLDVERAKHETERVLGLLYPGHTGEG